MRTEIKIGIAVGLIIAVAAVLYLVFAGPAGSVGTKQNQGTQATGAHAPVNQVERAGPGQASTPREALVPKMGSPAAAPSAVPVAEVKTIASPPPTPTTAAIAPAVAAAPSAASKPASIAPAAKPEAVPPADSGETAVKPVPPASATEGAYIVKEGDKGFWSIAEKVYGQGKYFYLLQRANPSLDSNNLRIGQKVIVPPLPAATPAAQRTAVPAAVTAADSEKTHIVQQDEKSWWSIAQKEYGNGKYWNDIKKANPQVEGTSLQAGMRLRIPPLAKTTPKPSPASAPAERPKAKPAPSVEEPSDIRPVFD